MSEIDYPPVNTDNWIQVGTEKKSGVLNLVRDSDDVGTVAVCWFKYRLNDDVGPVPANEFVTCKLGHLLDLPVAKIQFKEFSDKHGSISLVAAPEPYKWVQFPYKTKLPVYLEDYGLLAQIIVFDVFINNLDRNADNLLYAQVPTKKNKYALYLIDHGHCLLGPSSPPTPKETFNFEQHVMLPELKELFNHGIDFFEDAIIKIQNISETKIDNIIKCVPPEYLSDSQRSQLKEMLLYRQERLYNEIENYCEQKGSVT